MDDGACLKPEGDKVLRGVPATVRVENDQQEIAPVLGDLGNETSAGFGSKARFDPFDARDTTEESVSVVKHIGSISNDRHDD